MRAQSTVHPVKHWEIQCKWELAFKGWSWVNTYRLGCLFALIKWRNVLSIYLYVYIYISNSQSWTVSQHIFAWSPQGIYLMVSVFVSLSCPLGEDYLVWRNCHGYQLQAGPLKISGGLFPWRFRPWSGCEEGGTVRWWTCPLQKIIKRRQDFTPKYTSNPFRLNLNTALETMV